MRLIETRTNDGKKSSHVNFSTAILNPSASFGGLYVPETFPKLDSNFFEKNLTYKELASYILNAFGIDIAQSVIDEALSLYDKFDDNSNPAPLVKLDEKLYVSELWHGPTRAFKDMALQPFGHILSHLAKEQNQNYLILAATSGDTGPATLESFADKPNIKVACLYPDGGTSDVQRLQMVCAKGENLEILGIKGNFDDAQKALKSLLGSPTFNDFLREKNLKLSAANSVNFGRIIFQIIYHIWAYFGLLKDGAIKNGEKIHLTIPSGNFGNALGAYYAKKMGLPLEKILITSNINNILTELINTGVYDIRERKLLLTSSPAMDILISSNVERVLFDLFGGKRTKELMEELNQNLCYKLKSDELALLQEHFSAIHSDDNYAKDTIFELTNKGYLCDPHTATCFKSSELSNDGVVNVLCSTAQWTKFAPTIFSALQKNPKLHPDKVALEGVSNALHVKIPKSIKSLFEAQILHPKVVENCQIEGAIKEFLENSK